MPTGRGRAWADTRFAFASFVAGAPFLVDLLTNAPEVDTLTAVRIVGEITAFYDATIVPVDSESIVDLGIGVTSKEAFAIGATAVPSPTVATQYPPRGWLYVATLPVWTTVGTTGLIHQAASFSFDIRSMRKIDKGILYLLMEQNNITVGGAMSLTMRVRVLCLT